MITFVLIALLITTCYFLSVHHQHGHGKKSLGNVYILINVIFFFFVNGGCRYPSTHGRMTEAGIRRQWIEFGKTAKSADMNQLLPK